MTGISVFLTTLRTFSDVELRDGPIIPTNNYLIVSKAMKHFNSIPRSFQTSYLYNTAQ
jgi:hypothetical protein